MNKKNMQQLVLVLYLVLHLFSIDIHRSLYIQFADKHLFAMTLVGLLLFARIRCNDAR